MAAERMIAMNSATGVASQIPVTPKRAGRISIAARYTAFLNID